MSRFEIYWKEAWAVLATSFAGASLVSTFGTCDSSIRTGAAKREAKEDTLEFRAYTLVAVAEIVERDPGHLGLSEGDKDAFVEFVVAAVYFMGFGGNGSSSRLACSYGPQTPGEAERMWFVRGRPDQSIVCVTELIPLFAAFGSVLTDILGGLTRVIPSAFADQGQGRPRAGPGKWEAHVMTELLGVLRRLLKPPETLAHLRDSLPPDRITRFEAAKQDGSMLGYLGYLNEVIGSVKHVSPEIVLLAVCTSECSIQLLVEADAGGNSYLGCNGSLQPDCRNGFTREPLTSITCV